MKIYFVNTPNNFINVNIGIQGNSYYVIGFYLILIKQYIFSLSRKIGIQADINQLINHLII